MALVAYLMYSTDGKVFHTAHLQGKVGPETSRFSFEAFEDFCNSFSILLFGSEISDFDAPTTSGARRLARLPRWKTSPQLSDSPVLMLRQWMLERGKDPSSFIPVFCSLTVLIC